MYRVVLSSLVRSIVNVRQINELVAGAGWAGDALCWSKRGKLYLLSGDWGLELRWAPRAALALSLSLSITNIRVPSGIVTQRFRCKSVICPFALLGVLQSRERFYLNSSSRLVECSSS
jgi:hypothetical protein